MPSYMANCTKLFTCTCHPNIIDRGEHCMLTQQILSGLKQASQTWFSTFSHGIKFAGFQMESY